MKDMSEITIPETTITDEQYAYNARQLAMTIVHRAVRDYCYTTDKRRKAILKELRSPYMDLISDGISVIAAEQLELHADEIRERMQKNNNEDML